MRSHAPSLPDDRRAPHDVIDLVTSGTPDRHSMLWPNDDRPRPRIAQRPVEWPDARAFDLKACAGGVGFILVMSASAYAVLLALSKAVEFVASL